MPNRSNPDDPKSQQRLAAGSGASNIRRERYATDLARWEFPTAKVFSDPIQRAAFLAKQPISTENETNVPNGDPRRDNTPQAIPPPTPTAVPETTDAAALKEPRSTQRLYSEFQRKYVGSTAPVRPTLQIGPSDTTDDSINTTSSSRTLYVLKCRSCNRSALFGERTCVVHRK